MTIYKECQISGKKELEENCYFSQKIQMNSYYIAEVAKLKKSVLSLATVFIVRGNERSLTREPTYINFCISMCVNCNLLFSEDGQQSFSVCRAKEVAGGESEKII